MLTKNAITVLERRYLVKDAAGKVIETPDEMFWRVANAVAMAEDSTEPGNYVKVARDFHDMMADLKFLPNSPTLMNAGRELGQLSACFVLPVGDSIEEIFEAVKQTAIIHRSGGGTGFSFSRLRPANSRVGSTSGVSSGPVSFMHVFNAATEAIKQGGTRRGANMGMLRVDHPDIIEFIKAKEDPAMLTNFNLSVSVTDDFMDSVKEDAAYALCNPHTEELSHVQARPVWDLIIEKAWENGEPGVIFIDEMNRHNPTPSIGNYEASNPCGEQPLLPYESCNLGSINLSKMVDESVATPGFDYRELARVVRLAVHFLDNVIEINKYPLPEIEAMTKGNRKIGLGVMGWADALIKMRIPYDSEKAIELGRDVMCQLDTFAFGASVDLMMERGAYPNWCRETELKMRNATVTTIAPTGTISIIANCSSGIEPIFAREFTKNVMDEDQLGEVQVESEFIRTAHDVSPEWHVRMQAAFQEHTDNAVSKTVNMPHDATKEDVKKVFELAYELKCKGVTVYRDGSRENQVLTVVEAMEKGRQAAKEVFGVGVAGHKTVTVEDSGRPSVLAGHTFKVKTGCGSIYVTINEDTFGPSELFATIGKAGGCAESQAQAIGRMVSMAWQHGVSAQEVLKQLSDISCHSHCGIGPGKVRSCADAISKAIKGYLESKGALGSLPEPKVLVNGACRECGGKVEHEGGCVVCHSCGFSECG